MPTRRAAAAQAKSKLAASAGDDDRVDSDDGQQTTPPPTRTSAASRARPSRAAASKAPSSTGSAKSSTSTRRSTTRKSPPVEEEDVSVDADEQEEEEEEEDAVEEATPAPTKKPTSRAKASTRATTARTTKKQPRKVQDDEEEEEEEEEVPETSTTSIKTPQVEDPEEAAATSNSISQNEGKEEEDEEEEEDGDVTQTQVKTPEAGKAPLPDPQEAAPPRTPSSVKPAVPAGPKTRLTIHKMVLQDFKSYAGRQEIGPFHKSFSAVVGPNGSGKSNVIDALLFVFGWRANKMRQGKLGELIHNSAGKENLPSCSVEVWFREIEDLPGPDAFRVVPDSRLIVARTAFKNNTSVYTINGRKSNFTEVTTMLKGRGIDLDHKRFLILQGEVESIAQMPPKGKTEHEEGLLEYLEDIIGTSEYAAPIEQAAVRVDECNEQRSAKLERLKFVQKEKQSLENKKREAEAYLRDQNELTQRQSALWQVYMMECRKQMAVASAAIETLQARLDAENEKHAGSREQVDKLNAELERVTREFKAAEKEAEKVGKEFAKYEKESLQAEEKQKHVEGKKKKIEKSIADEKKAETQAKSTIKNSAEESEKLEKEMSKLEASLEQEELKLEKIRDGLKDKTQGFTAGIEERQRELQPWTSKIMEQKNARALAVEERALLSVRGEQAAERVKEAEAALEELAADAHANAEALESLRQEKSEVGRKIDAAASQLKQMKAEEQKLRDAAAHARSKADEAKSASSNQKARSQVLNSLMRQAELGMIKGFHGRLGSLGTIDEKFDVAISTACPGLENIVVENVEAGQACIEHLRKNNLGRANFILLDSLEKNEIPNVQTPDGAPRLIDLVKPKSEIYTKAFYHQLRDTLVAKDLNHANKIAYGATRWRVVTLDGQLIDKSGAMSGGGAKVAKGAMSSKLQADEMTPEKLARLEKEKTLAEDALRSHVKAIQDVEDLAERHRSRAPQIDIDIEKAQMAIEVSKRRRVEAQKRVKSLREESGPDATEAARIAELDTRIEKIDGEISKLSEKTAAIEASINELQEKILEVGGIELRAQKSKVDGIVQMMELNNERITKANVSKAKAEKDLVKAGKAIAELEASLESLEEELQNVGAGINANDGEAQAAHAKVQEAHDLLEEKQMKRESLQEELEEFSDDINAFRAVQMELKQKLEDNERSLADNRKRLAHWTEKHASLRLHELDDAEADTEVDGEAKEEDAPLELVEYPEEELAAIDTESIKAEIVVFEERISKGHANLSILEEYRKREQDFLRQARELEATTQARDEAKKQYDMLRKERLDRFMAGFSIISSKLKEMYQTITLGGNAELELVDSLDPFSEGIIFSVMPPKKSWKNISNLSGGEKTLSSLALVFALHAFKPTPLYVMDEIDAALDFRNVSIVANLIKERTKNAQFVIISLRNNMFELASRLVGIYKTSSMTKSLTIENKDLHQMGVQRPSMQVPSSTVRRSLATPASKLATNDQTPSTGGKTSVVDTSDVMATPLATKVNM